ncbi:MAG TPA: 16S rRNA (guanine(527)-N(7))-methyltransferase RsmG [Burkholderiales bacterium]|jgi:16S rRNA (guanine527-N7)-methyltransferase
MTPRAALERGLNELALGLPADACDRLEGYVALLAKWNRTYNLTAIRDPLEMVSRHLLDSLSVLPHLPMSAGAALADVGSGPGLPGIPLAIARSEWRVTLNDSNHKMCAFQRQATIELGLANVAVHEGRVESWQPASRFAVVISRAFAALPEFIAACRHLVAPQGVIAAMAGALPEAPARGCSAVELRVPLLDARRHLVLCPVGS